MMMEDAGDRPLHPEEVGPFDDWTDAQFTTLVTFIRRETRMGGWKPPLAVPEREVTDYVPDEYMFAQGSWEVIDHVPQPVRKAWGNTDQPWHALRRNATL